MLLSSVHIVFLSQHPKQSEVQEYPGEIKIIGYPGQKISECKLFLGIGISPLHCMSPVLSWVDFGFVLQPCVQLCLMDPFPTGCTLCVGLVQLLPSLAVLRDPRGSAQHVQTLQDCTPHCPGWGHPPPPACPPSGRGCPVLPWTMNCAVTLVRSLLPASLGKCCQNYSYPFHHSHFSACTGFHDMHLLEDPFGVLGRASHAPDKNKDLSKGGKISNLPSENPDIYSKPKCSIMLLTPHREIASENLGLCLLHIF